MKTARKSMTAGYLVPVLHAHLPYVRYPEHAEHLEEMWLHEAITESYIPLILMLEDLLNDRTDFKITLSLTPSLLEMLGDELLMQRFQVYIQSRIELAEKEIFRTRNESGIGQLSKIYLAQFKKTKNYFEQTCRKDLVSAFRMLSGSGKVELITSAATHAYLPLHIAEPATLRTQLEIGANTFRRHIKKEPAGLWLPECGYAPGLGDMIKKSGFSYFFLESHGLLNGKPKPRKSIYLPVRTPEDAVVFARDTESSRQVWSALYGYPGDHDYRDFYRDIGFDLDYDYVKPFLPGGTRTFTGMKYFRITGKTDLKEIYNRERAMMKAALHAEHFMQERDRQVMLLGEKLKIRPVITAAYDAELFGHWWHEGPEWLRFVLRNPSISRRQFRFATPSELLQETDRSEVVSPSESSWGKSGYSSVWLDHTNSWIYRHLKKAAEMMAELSTENRNASGLPERALNQALRELLLAQSSDWPFMMKMGNAAEFAEGKFREHIRNFFTLCGGISMRDIPEAELVRLERKNNIFRDIDFRIYSKKP